MTVWAVHEVKDDISPAARFGAIRYVNQFYIHGDELEPVPDNTSDLRIPRGYAANMERCAAEFDPVGDFLVIAGDHLQLLALTAILTARYGTLSVLRWDRHLRDYIPVRLSSGLVPPRQAVLSSGTDIGETEHGESRKPPNYDEIARITREHVQALALDGPHRRAKRAPPQDDH